MIYLSTGYMKKSSEILFKKFKKFGINNIEFSSGIYEKNKVQSILKKKNLFNLTIHNYFPPPKKPFTMNLGSLNDQIYSETYKLIKKNIDYSSKIGSQFYSFHAGFLIDPLPRELGKKIVSKKINNEAKVEKKFLFGLKKLSNYAQKKKR